MQRICEELTCLDYNEPIPNKHIHVHKKYDQEYNLESTFRPEVVGLFCNLEGCTEYKRKVSMNHEHQLTGSEAKNSYRVPLQVRYDLIPPIILRELSLIYDEGAHKYGQQKYVEKPLPFSSLMNHLMNHLMLYASNDRSEKHLAKVIWNAATMLVLDDLFHKGLLPNMNDLTEFGSFFNEAMGRRAIGDTE